jgi:hypothetical protein
VWTLQAVRFKTLLLADTTCPDDHLSFFIQAIGCGELFTPATEHFSWK